MKSLRLELAIKSYEDRLDVLEEVIDNIPQENSLLEQQGLLITTQRQISHRVLNILTIRDEIEAAIKKSPQVSANNINIIAQLDQQLQKFLKTLIERDYKLKTKFKSANRSQGFTPAIQLSKWRASVNPQEGVWWWFWEKEVSQPNHDWVWRVISLACWTFSLTLFGNIIPRFLVARPDLFSSFVVSFQSVLTLLTGGKLLPQKERNVFKKILFKQTSQRFWDNTSVVSSGGLMLVMILFRFSLPCFANLYNTWGQKDYDQYKLPSAESNYRRAIALNPEYIEAYFNLGLVYEDLQDFKQARTQYEIAFQGEYPPAWNNIARLNIRDKKYSDAEGLLLQLQLRYFGQMDNQTKSAFWKNLGWVKWKKNKYQQAKVDLKQAIDLKENSEEWAAPHCLLAKVLEKLKEQPTALMQWRKCLNEINFRDPDEVRWGAIAAERFEPKKSQP